MNRSNELIAQVFSTSGSRLPWLEAEAEEAISSIELAAYHLGVLPQEHLGEAEAYLNQNPSHLAEFALLDNYLSDLADELPPVPEASATWWEQVGEGMRVLMANLVSPAQGQPAFALLGDNNGPKMYEVKAALPAEEVEVMIQVEEDDEVPNRKMLLGLIMGLEPEGLTAHLWQATPLAEVSTIEVDEFGNFIMPALESGQYELILTNNKIEIHLPNIEI